MANKKLAESDLILLFKKQELILKELLNYSQRQFAESDSVGLEGLLSQKEHCFSEMQKVDLLLEKWHSQYRRDLNESEKALNQVLQDLLAKILHSEREFSQIIGREKKAVSLQIEELSRQMKYRKEPLQQRAKIKNMTT